MKSRKALLAITLLSLISCKDLFQYSPKEVRLEGDEKNLNLKNIPKIESQPKKDTLKFVLIGDTQRFYDETQAFVSAVNKQADISFVVLAGDISDFGLGKEFKWVHRELEKLKMPYIGVIGNHDMLSNGRLIYNEMYGPDNFSFTCNGNKFICLNTNSREVGNDGSIPNLSWLSRELNAAATSKNVFVISHVPPFSLDYDPNLEKPYASLLANSKNVRASLHAHDHTTRTSRPYEDGLEYFVIGTVNKSTYAVVKVWNEGYKIEEHVF
jgi:predicted phosphodiesterase